MSGLLGFNAQGAALVLILAAAVLVYLVGHANGISSQSRTRRFPTPFRRSQAGQAQVLNLKDVGDQLQAVMRASFQTRRVLSPSEYRVFRIIEDDVATMRKGHRVFAQTSLGEVLQSRSADAFASINSKRIDVLVIDRRGFPVLAVEHQGEGHYQGTAAARDAIKKEALRKAGVPYLEISETDSDDKIRLGVREYLGLHGGNALRDFAPRERSLT